MNRSGATPANCRRIHALFTHVPPKIHSSTPFVPNPYLVPVKRFLTTKEDDSNHSESVKSSPTIKKPSKLKKSKVDLSLVKLSDMPGLVNLDNIKEEAEAAGVKLNQLPSTTARLKTRPKRKSKNRRPTRITIQEALLRQNEVRQKQRVTRLKTRLLKYSVQQQFLQKFAKRLEVWTKKREEALSTGEKIPKRPKLYPPTRTRKSVMRGSIKQKHRRRLKISLFKRDEILQKVIPSQVSNDELLKLFQTRKIQLDSSKLPEPYYLSEQEQRILDQEFERQFAQLSKINTLKDTYVKHSPKNRFILNSLVMGKVLSQSSNLTRYKIEAFRKPQVEACVDKIKRKQDALYEYLMNQVTVRLNSVVYEIQRNFENTQVQKLESLPSPVSLLQFSSTPLSRVQQRAPSGIPLSKIKEAFLLRSFQAYLMKTNVFSRAIIPTRKPIYTILKSTHVNKKARDQFRFESTKFVVVCSPLMKLFDDVLQDELAFSGCRVKSIREENVRHEV